MTHNKYTSGAVPVPQLRCVDGPHTFHWKMKKQSDNVYVGDKSHSQWKGGCCVSMCHNDDKMELENGVWRFTPGDNLDGAALPQAQADDAQKVGGAPPMANATMER